MTTADITKIGDGQKSASKVKRWNSWIFRILFCFVFKVISKKIRNFTWNHLNVHVCCCYLKFILMIQKNDLSIISCSYIYEENSHVPYLWNISFHVWMKVTQTTKIWTSFLPYWISYCFCSSCVKLDPPSIVIFQCGKLLLAEMQDVWPLK